VYTSKEFIACHILSSKKPYGRRLRRTFPLTDTPAGKYHISKVAKMGETNGVFVISGD
jgi:hypothetical protein